MSDLREAQPAAEMPGDSFLDDPEIQALLDFDPVPRAREVENAWTPELQREFMARLAVHGSAARACEEMGKNRTGVTKLYRSPDGASFRGVWHAAVELAKRRKAAATRFVSPGIVPPTIDNRRKRQWDAAAGDHPSAGAGPDLREDQKQDLIHSIGVKLMKKVAAERQARLDGEIVAADFYLRQATMMEVVFDLMSCELGFDPHDMLYGLRRGEHCILEIASTWFSDWMDRARRMWWLEEGEPERPPHPDASYLKRHRSGEGDYASQPSHSEYGALSTPARGYTEEQWAGMNTAEQRAAREKQFREDAAEQVEWERRAHADWEARQSSSPA